LIGAVIGSNKLIKNRVLIEEQTHMLIIDKKSNKNKVFKLFSRKFKEHTENTEIKVNIDIFYELFRLRGR